MAYPRASDPLNYAEYDPTPFSGGYDQVSLYGRPKSPSSETCYPVSEKHSSQGSGSYGGHGGGYGDDSSSGYGVDKHRPTEQSDYPPHGSGDFGSSGYGGGGYGSGHGRPKQRPHDDEGGYGGYAPSYEQEGGGRHGPAAYEEGGQDYGSGYGGEEGYGKRPGYGGPGYGEPGRQQYGGHQHRPPAPGQDEYYSGPPDPYQTEGGFGQSEAFSDAPPGGYGGGPRPGGYGGGDPPSFFGDEPPAPDQGYGGYQGDEPRHGHHHHRHHWGRDDE